MINPTFDRLVDGMECLFQHPFAPFLHFCLRLIFMDNISVYISDYDAQVVGTEFYSDEICGISSDLERNGSSSEVGTESVPIRRQALLMSR